MIFSREWVDEFTVRVPQILTKAEAVGLYSEHGNKVALWCAPHGDEAVDLDVFVMYWFDWLEHAEIEVRLKADGRQGYLSPASVFPCDSCNEKPVVVKTHRQLISTLQRATKGRDCWCRGCQSKIYSDAIMIIGQTQPETARSFESRVNFPETATTYSQYLASDHWRETRRRALIRADHACQLCAATDRLQVHHRTYARLGRERDSDLTVLCHECHETFHRAVLRPKEIEYDDNIMTTAREF